MTDMKKYLGIDLGTSALKLLLLSPDGSRLRAKCAYETADPAGWLAALKAAIVQLKQQDSLMIWQASLFLLRLALTF